MTAQIIVTQIVMPAMLMIIILGTLIYYNKKNIPPRSCGNCRFYNTDDSVCEISIYTSVCDQWDWNGERDKQQ